MSEPMRVDCENWDCESFREWLSGEKAKAEQAARRFEVEVERLRAGEAEIETRVHAMFAEADERGVILDALTVEHLTRMVMHAIRGGRS